MMMMLMMMMMMMIIIIIIIINKIRENVITANSRVRFCFAKSHEKTCSVLFLASCQLSTLFPTMNK